MCYVNVVAIKRAGFALIATLFYVALVNAADLNAPINTTPTVGSEIRRGMDAGYSQCPRIIDALTSERSERCRPF